MRLRPMGGLGNKLRALLSYRSVHGPIECEWVEGLQIGAGHPRDVFEPIEGVTWVEPREGPFTHHGGPVTLTDGTIADNHCAPMSTLRWMIGLGEIKLLPDLIKLLPTRPYVAVHVRRTDHVQLAHAMGCAVDDYHFISWAKRHMSRRIYLATDNATTQRAMAAALGRATMVPVLSPTVLGDADEHDVRNSDLASAALDLFACVRAAHFLGTPGSSFTSTIESMRALGGWWTC